MAIFVKRDNGSIAGFPDDKELAAQSYADSIGGTIVHVDDVTGEETPETSAADTTA